MVPECDLPNDLVIRRIYDAQPSAVSYSEADVDQFGDWVVSHVVGVSREGDSSYYTKSACVDDVHRPVTPVGNEERVSLWNVDDSLRFVEPGDRADHSAFSKVHDEY